MITKVGRRVIEIELPYKSSLTPPLNNSNGLETYKDTGDIVSRIRELRMNNKITEDQAKGIFLEVPVYMTLLNLGIQPTPLKNPYNEEYPIEYHLTIDHLFYHKGLLFGDECKNLSPRSRRAINRHWVDREVIKRYINISKVCSIDEKIVVVSMYRDLISGYLDSSYKVIEVGYQVFPPLWSQVVFSLSKQFKSLFNQTDQEDSPDMQHGSYQIYYDKLRYIKQKLLDEYLEDKQLEEIIK